MKAIAMVKRLAELWQPLPRIMVVLVGGVVVAALWLGADSLRRDDPANPPRTIYWHGCSYTSQDVMETFDSATAFQHQAAARRNLGLRQIGKDGGLPIYGVISESDQSYGCSPWIIHLQVGPDRLRRYQRPGGP